MTRTSADEFPKAVKLQAWLRSGGVCECGCGVKIIAGDGPEYDHVLEARLGGKPVLENCKVLRKRCHKAKTGDRRPVLDKVRSLSEKLANARAKGPAMPGTKRSGLKKKFNGEVVER